MHAYNKYTNIHACMHACMHTYIHTYIHTYVFAWSGEGSSKSAKGKDAISKPDPKDLAHSGAMEGKEEAATTGDRGGGGGGGVGGGVRSEARGKKGTGGGGEKTVCDGCGGKLKNSKVAGDKTQFTFREHGGKRSERFY
jgi:hypothetical protein